MQYGSEGPIPFSFSFFWSLYTGSNTVCPKASQARRGAPTPPSTKMAEWAIETQSLVER